MKYYSRNLFYPYFKNKNRQMRNTSLETCENVFNNVNFCQSCKSFQLYLYFW
ncbi:hypothetical protein HanIR_Chr09g0411511 [Helianthus annuus]|nr:hypothetical protein HanIR_Chr09g0411511 [Helianthus annuus]